MEEAKSRIGNGTEIGRRDFLGLGAAAAASVFMPVLKADICADLRDDASSARFDDNLVAFLADIHAGADKKCSVARRKFKETVDEILAMRPLPRNVLVFGDIAYRCGQGADYDFSRPLFRKLEDAGIVVTIGMGNHDRRSEYAKRWPEAAAKSLVPGRYVHLVETPHVDFLMLDSLQGQDNRDSADEGPQGGALSKDEQVFLKKFLALRAKPVIVCAHHPCSDLWCGGERLEAVLRSSPGVAGYIHGHFHRWRTEGEREVCLPSASAWGDVGYATCRCRPDCATIDGVLKGFSIPSPAGDPMVTVPVRSAVRSVSLDFCPDAPSC